MKFSAKDPREPKLKIAFFPKKCIHCGRKFWLEKGWERYLGRESFVNCCNECARSKEEAREKCVITYKRPKSPGK